MFRTSNSLTAAKRVPGTVLSHSAVHDKIGRETNIKVAGIGEKECWIDG